jgi:hypothetical protein
LVQITLPYIFIIACVGLITNTATIALLSKSFATQNAKNKWILIALGMLHINSSIYIFNLAFQITFLREK